MKDKYQGLTIAEKSRLKVIDEIAKLDLDGMANYRVPKNAICGVCARNTTPMRLVVALRVRML